MPGRKNTAEAYEILLRIAQKREEETKKAAAVDPTRSPQVFGGQRGQQLGEARKLGGRTYGKVSGQRGTRPVFGRRDDTIRKDATREDAVREELVAPRGGRDLDDAACETAEHGFQEHVPESTSGAATDSSIVAASKPTPRDGVFGRAADRFFGRRGVEDGAETSGGVSGRSGKSGTRPRGDLAASRRPVRRVDSKASAADAKASPAEAARPEIAMRREWLLLPPARAAATDATDTELPVGPRLPFPEPAPMAATPTGPTGPISEPSTTPAAREELKIHLVTGGAVTREAGGGSRWSGEVFADTTPGAGAPPPEPPIGDDGADGENGDSGGGGGSGDDPSVEASTAETPTKSATTGGGSSKKRRRRSPPADEPRDDIAAAVPEPVASEDVTSETGAPVLDEGARDGGAIVRPDSCRYTWESALRIALGVAATVFVIPLRAIRWVVGDTATRMLSSSVQMRVSTLAISAITLVIVLSLIGIYLNRNTGSFVPPEDFRGNYGLEEPGPAAFPESPGAPAAVRTPLEQGPPEGLWVRNEAGARAGSEFRDVQAVPGEVLPEDERRCWLRMRSKMDDKERAKLVDFLVKLKFRVQQDVGEATVRRSLAYKEIVWTRDEDGAMVHMGPFAECGDAVEAKADLLALTRTDMIFDWYGPKKHYFRGTFPVNEDDKIADARKRNHISHKTPWAK